MTAARRSIARNTVWNLLGNGAPALVAIVTIPSLMSALGTDRFGALTIAWIVMGYFGIFDLGLSRATTRFVAEMTPEEQGRSLTPLVATSVAGHLALGLLGGASLAALTPWLVGSLLKVPPELVSEMRSTFYVLAASVPIIVVTSAPRGVLEALHRFDLVNAVKTPASLLTYVAPLAIAQWTRDLGLVVGAIALLRVGVLITYSWMAIHATAMQRDAVRVDAPLLRALFRYGAWLMVPSLVAPAVASIDRFVIAGQVSLTAVAYYATPYEVVSRLWLISSSVLAVLFPVFSNLGVQRVGELDDLSRRAVRYLLVMGMVPIVIAIGLAEELLTLWLGASFAAASVTVARLIAVGMLFSLIAQVPFTVLQSVGHASIPAKIHLAGLPLYAIAIWFCARRFGINGVAAAWSARAAIGAAATFAAARISLYRDVPGLQSARWLSAAFVTAMTMGAAWATIPIGSITFKVLALLAICSAFSIWAWRGFFDEIDRAGILRKTRSLAGMFGA